jgi:hypothetical protein
MSEQLPEKTAEALSPHAKMHVEWSVGKRELTITYRIVNTGATPIYVLDLLPSVDPQTRKPGVNSSAAYVALPGQRQARVMRGIHPVPPTTFVAAAVMPLGTRLEENESVERSLALALPLRQQSCYDWAKRSVELESESVDQVEFIVQYVTLSTEGLEARPAPNGEGLYRIWAKNLSGSVLPLAAPLPVEDLPCLRRKAK